MSELKDQIYQILCRPQLTSLATLTADGKPWVRYVMALTDEELTLRFATVIQARKVTQIKANPEVHLTCGVTNPSELTPYLQIQGKAVLKTDEATRHAFWDDMLKPIFSGPDDPKYGVIEVTPYQIEHCTPGSYEPKIWTA
ncbi:MAG: pyridoxamine 5'-phosphate oxidase family protein [Phycisphaeraceae bacterium]|nr:pyridoxamine 5'-phosphate oxidase family protein [Phycisphaeraceae bacterium]